MGQEPDVGGHFVGALGNARERGQGLGIDLSRIGLTADGIAASKPILRQMSSSNLRTFSWSPWKSSRKLACVPVVPFEPRALRLARRCSISARSMTKSYAQRQARLPTVVGWAGCKCVKPRQGRSRYFLAKSASALDYRHHPAADKFKRLAQ